MKIRSVWEINQNTWVDMAGDHGIYVDHSQSLDIHTDQPNLESLNKQRTFMDESEILDCLML